jgi:hypothetical protein
MWDEPSGRVDAHLACPRCALGAEPDAALARAFRRRSLLREARQQVPRESQMSLLTAARRPWTADEQKKLDDLTKAGKTAAEIATALQRTPQSIYSLLQRLDIKRRKAARRLVELGLKARK